MTCSKNNKTTKKQKNEKHSKVDDLQNIIDQNKIQMNILQTECVALKKYENLFSVPGDAADYVMSTDVNAEWMDDTVERKYIISVLKCLNEFILSSTELKHEAESESDSDPESTGSTISL